MQVLVSQNFQMGMQIPLEITNLYTGENLRFRLECIVYNIHVGNYIFKIHNIYKDSSVNYIGDNMIELTMDKILARPDREYECIQLLEQLERAGYTATLYDICEAWMEYSDKLCAGWMGLDKDEQTNVDILLAIMVEKQNE